MLDLKVLGIQAAAACGLQNPLRSERVNPRKAGHP